MLMRGSGHVDADVIRSKLEDALSRKLQYRPTKDEVVQRNIL